MIDVKKFQDYRAFLKSHAEAARLRNKNWSLAVWARQLGLKSKSPLVMVLTGKRELSGKLNKKLIEYFKFSVSERQHFELLVAMAERAPRGIQRVHIAQDSLDQKVSETDRYRASWLAFVVKEIRNYKSLSAAQVQELLFAQIPLGEIQRTLEALQSDETMRWTAELLRQIHQNIVKAAADAFDNSTADERVMQTSFMKVSRERLAEARVHIQAFQREFTERFESDSADDQVFQLNLQCFPLTKNIRVGRKA